MCLLSLLSLFYDAQQPSPPSPASTYPTNIFHTMRFTLRLFALAPLLRVVAAIVGESTEAKTPGFMVSVQTSDLFSDQHICGGVILGKQTVLTTASCLDGHSASKLTVKYGSVNRSELARAGLLVTQVIKHPNWSPNTKDFDIGILHLLYEIDAQGGPAYQVAKIAQTHPAITDTKSARFAGWGKTKTSNALPVILRQADVRYVSHSDCKTKYSDSVFTEQMGCLDSTASIPCDLDTGGPIMDKSMTTLYGILSYGDIACNPGSTTRPYVYSDVVTVRPWIQSQTY
ncbi:trypsin-like serine protease [Violaceomyces palustris]|uniref:Trypsin-like serine protease n=1 Tax=Violaceomyces palustris TaxID=1673888 RepID=A0ACD0P5S5_9BASI|nr:trypsin-like serine protease [Violaceomyces palustris]